MAQSPTAGSTYSSRVRPSNDVYTVLVITSVSVVAGTIALVIYKSVELFGTAFPGFAS